MKNLSSIYLVFIVFIFSVVSCTKDISLEPESLITVNSFWKTKEDALGGLYGMYNQFREEARANLYYYGSARSEIMGHGLQNADFRIKYFENSLSSSNADRDWLRLYRIVDYANLVIKFVPDIDFPTDSEKNNIIAQAYAMRAFVYFTMAKTWGDLPIVTEPVEGFDAEKTFVARSPVSQVFDLIKSDIETALNLFPDNNLPEGKSVWSKPAVNTLKADVFLWTGKLMGGGDSDLNTALAAINSVESASLTLLDDFPSIFSYGNKGNDEIIFAVHFRDLEVGNNYFGDMYINALDLGAPNIPEDVKAKIPTAGGFNWWAPTALVRDQFTNDDQRKDASFLEIYQVENGDSTFLTSVVLKARGFGDAGVQKFLDDILIYRYGELLLMKAEIKNALGQDPSEEINRIRMRAYGDNFAAHEFISGTQAENDEAILQERLFELIFEGKRWWDLVRFGKAFEKVPSLEGRDADTYLLLWPITESTISLNSKIQQNNGY
ncbi:MAG: RagB/SusD family nutrient uptake outer membrane protein [Saprospiraceae bacterium]|nr:RagB/SusD family nutrient uptake outer membrane protein [Saprospiraceae bacterium]